MKKLLLARCASAADRTGAGRDRLHPDGERARHPLTSRTLLPEFEQADRHRRRDRGRQLRRDAHQAGAAAGRADRAATTRSWSTSTGSASSPRRAGCSRSTSASQQDKRRHLRLRPSADEPRRQGRRRHLHAALLQLRHGPDSIARTCSTTRRNKQAFKAKYGMELRVPETWDEYLKQVEFFTRDTDGDGQTDFYGVVNQGLRPDPIAMEWSNYLYRQWRPVLRRRNWKRDAQQPEAGARRSRNTRTNIEQVRPARRRELQLRRGVQRAGQGKAYSYITYNFFRAAFDDPSQSQVVGKVEIARRMPGSGGLNGAWGWAIPKSSPEPGRGLDLHQVDRVARDREEARAARRLADPHRRLRRCRGAGEVPALPALQALLLETPQFPDLHLHAGVRRGARARAVARRRPARRTPEEALAQAARSSTAGCEGRQAEGLSHAIGKGWLF